MNMLVRSAGLLLVPLCFGAAAVAQVADARVDEALAVWKEQRRRSLTGEPDPAAARAVGDLAVEELSLAQLERFCEVMLPQTADDSLGERFAVRLDVLAESPTADGAVAAARLCELRRDERATWLDGIAQAAKHPGLAEAFAAGDALSLCRQVYFFRDPAALAERGVFAALTPMVTDSWPPRQVRELLCLQEPACDDSAGLEPAERERLRVTTLGVLDAALADEALEARERTYLSGRRDTLDGAAARGELVGHAAPKVEVLWSNRAPKADGFADLKGRIVVVDFWATWCVPCVAAFPHLAELVERYEGLPVEFVGITSLQGRVTYPRAEDPAKRRVTTADPEAELALLGPWCEEMGVTWTMWVTRENCFNPDFGVRAIPHVAVIGADGAVVTNGLSPRGNALEDLVDGLLRKMGHAPPPRDGRR